MAEIPETSLLFGPHNDMQCHWSFFSQVCLVESSSRKPSRSWVPLPTFEAAVHAADNSSDTGTVGLAG